MDNISIEIYEYFDDILKSFDLETDFFLTSYSGDDRDYFFIKNIKEGIMIEFDITMPNTHNIRQYILKIPELHQKGVIFNYEEHESRFDDETGKRKYKFDLNISKYFIRNFKLKKLFL